MVSILSMENKYTGGYVYRSLPGVVVIIDVF